MNYTRIERQHEVYLYFGSADTPIQSEQDALDLVALSIENGTGKLMIHSDALSDDFFKLRTGLAGVVLQKLVNYRIKTAVIIPSELAIKGRAKEMMAELNKGKEFRAFGSVEEAEAWLLD